jgi:asparagine synthetase B (glutamine-hydrolysing)
LKKLGERLGIPSALLHRRKQGFQLPLVDWMRDSMKDQFLRVLLEPRTLQRGYFKPEAVRQLVEEHTRGRRNRSGVLWRMLVLELWHRNFMEARASRQDIAPLVSSTAMHGASVSSSSATPGGTDR